MAFPANVDSGRIVGRFIFGVVDGPDADEEPDFAAAVGTITFTPSVKYIPVQGDVEEPFTLVPATITGVLDENGYLCTPSPDDPLMAGYPGIKMIATDDPNFLVQDWTWQVTYKLESAPYVTVPIPAHSITVPGGSIQDLSILTQVPSAPGYGLPQAEEAARRAEAAAQSVVDRADSGEFKGDPGNATMRVDNTVGHRVFVTDGAIERLVMGDTGMRDITALLAGAVFDKTGSSRKLLMRRADQSVEISGQLLVAQDSASGQTFLNVPKGFRVAGRVETTGAQIRSGASLTRISGAYGLGLYTFEGATYPDLKAGDVINLSISYQTTDAWPTSLPGSPA